MAFAQYQTLLPQADYPMYGLVSTIIGFFLLSYFLMYLCLLSLAIRSPTNLMSGH